MLFSPVILKIFSWTVVLSNLICVNVLFMFLMLGVHWASWIYFFGLSNWEHFQPLFFQIFFSVPPPLGTSFICTLDCLKLFHAYWFCSLFSTFFFFKSVCFILDNFYYYDFKSTNLFLFFLEHLICCWFYPVCFSPRCCSFYQV